MLLNRHRHGLTLSRNLECPEAPKASTSRLAQRVQSYLAARFQWLVLRPVSSGHLETAVVAQGLVQIDIAMQRPAYLGTRQEPAAMALFVETTCRGIERLLAISLYDLFGVPTAPLLAPLPDECDADALARRPSKLPSSFGTHCAIGNALIVDI